MRPAIVVIALVNLAIYIWLLFGKRTRWIAALALLLLVVSAALLAALESR